MEEPVKQKTLQELEEEHLTALINCFILVWQSNPTKNTVKLILDGGENTFYLKRERFIEIISDILYSTRNPESLKLVAMVKTSLDDYGNLFMFNKQTQELRQLVRTNDELNEIKEELKRHKKNDSEQFTEQLDSHATEKIFEMDMKDNLKKKSHQKETKCRYDFGDFRKRFM